MISSLQASVSGGSGGSAALQSSLVTARLFDCSDGDRQREAEALANDVAKRALFHALYLLPSAHVGFIAHMMTTVQDLQPNKIKLIISFARDHVCLQRAASCCTVSMRPLSHVFGSDLGSIRGELLPPGRFSHALVISSNDDGLLAFAARCVDEMMRSGSFGAHNQCWLPYRSSAADGSWRPRKEDWVQLSSSENPNSLSEVLSASKILVRTDNRTSRPRERSQDGQSKKSNFRSSSATSSPGTTYAPLSTLLLEATFEPKETCLAPLPLPEDVDRVLLAAFGGMGALGGDLATAAASDVVDVVGEERQLRLKIPRYESKVEKKDESSWRIYEVGVIMHRVPLVNFLLHSSSLILLKAFNKVQLNFFSMNNLFSYSYLPVTVTQQGPCQLLSR
jgi:hypothetical protein